MAVGRSTSFSVGVRSVSVALRTVGLITSDSVGVLGVSVRLAAVGMSADDTIISAVLIVVVNELAAG